MGRGVERKVWCHMREWSVYTVLRGTMLINMIGGSSRPQVKHQSWHRRECARFRAHEFHCTQIPLEATCLSISNHRSNRNNAKIAEMCCWRAPLAHPSLGVDWKTCRVACQDYKAYARSHSRTSGRGLTSTRGCPCNRQSACKNKSAVSKKCLFLAKESHMKSTYYKHVIFVSICTV
jgi:hypothetical protein